MKLMIVLLTMTIAATSFAGSRNEEKINDGRTVLETLVKYPQLQQQLTSLGQAFLFTPAVREIVVSFEQNYEDVENPFCLVKYKVSYGHLKEKGWIEDVKFVAGYTGPSITEEVVGYCEDVQL